MKRNKRSKLVIKDKKRFIKSVLTLALVIVYVYVIINRCQDVNGLDWFFTTWH